MRIHHLGLAAASALLSMAATPALAEAPGAFALSAAPAAGPPAVRVHRGSGPSSPVFGHQWTDGREGHRGSGRRDRGTVVVGSWYGGEWALYNNRSWDAESFNDWWHDRPERAFPRWMQHNQDCQRLWWGGGNWRC